MSRELSEAGLFRFLRQLVTEEKKGLNISQLVCSGSRFSLPAMPVLSLSCPRKSSVTVFFTCQQQECLTRICC